MNILNSGDREGPEGSKSAEELSRQLQKSMLRLKGEYMSADGRGIDYAGLASSGTFQEYVAMSWLLAQCDLSVMTEDARKVFFISILVQDTCWNRVVADGVSL